MLSDADLEGGLASAMQNKDKLTAVGRGFIWLFGTALVILGLIVGLLNDHQKASVISHLATWGLSVPVWGWFVPIALFIVGFSIWFFRKGAPKPKAETTDSSTTINVSNSGFVGPTTLGDNSPITQHIHNYGDTGLIAAKPPNIAIKAICFREDYQAGFVFAGIRWEEHYSDLRVHITNNDDTAYTDFDAIITTDQAITGAALISQLNTGSCVAAHSMPSPMIVGRNSLNNKEQVISPQGGMLAHIEVGSHYRVNCNKIAALSSIEVVLAVVLRPTLETWLKPSTEKIAPQWVEVDASFTFNSRQHKKSEKIGLTKAE